MILLSLLLLLMFVFVSYFLFFFLLCYGKSNASYFTNPIIVNIIECFSNVAFYNLKVTTTILELFFVLVKKKTHSLQSALKNGCLLLLLHQQ